VTEGSTRECLTVRIDRRLRSTDVIDVLSDLFILRDVLACAFRQRPGVRAIPAV